MWWTCSSRWSTHGRRMTAVDHSNSSSSSLSASTAAKTGAHSSSTASRSGEQGAVSRPLAFSSSSWTRNSASRCLRASMAFTGGRSSLADRCRHGAAQRQPVISSDGPGRRDVPASQGLTKGGAAGGFHRCEAKNRAPPPRRPPAREHSERRLAARCTMGSPACLLTVVALLPAQARAPKRSMPWAGACRRNGSGKQCAAAGPGAPGSWGHGLGPSCPGDSSDGADRAACCARRQLGRAC